MADLSGGCVVAPAASHNAALRGRTVNRQRKPQPSSSCMFYQRSHK